MPPNQATIRISADEFFCLGALQRSCNEKKKRIEKAIVALYASIPNGTLISGQSKKSALTAASVLCVDIN